MVRLCDLVVSLGLILHTRMRKANLCGDIKEIENIFVLLNSLLRLKTCKISI